MTSFATKAAARRFSSVLKEADRAPVFIERHKRPRAVVVSIRRFRLYEKLLAQLLDEAAVDSLESALEMTRQGRLGLARRACKDAALLGGTDAPSPGGKGGA